MESAGQSLYDLTSIVGRRVEIAGLIGLVIGLDHRLVVLTGPGGVGKTRLALHVAQEIPAESFERVVVVELETSHTAEDGLREITRVLGRVVDVDESAAAAAVEFIGQRRILLILDTVEHIPELGRLLVAILERCRQLTVLATSRSVLGVSGEYVFQLQPMTFPATDVDNLDIVQARAFDSMRLFEDRAKLANPSFQINRVNARFVAEICRQVDGLPLAVELAAARAGVFSVETIASRLKDDVSILGDGPRNVSERQQTIERTIAWSFDLLSESARRAAYNLALFRGNWSLDDAVALLGAEQGGGEQPIHEVVTSLLDSSLIRRAVVPGELPHFTMLQLIRSFGLRRLEASSEFDFALQRRDDWAIQLMAAAEPELVGPHQIEWLNRIDQVFVDLSLAFWHLVDVQRHADALLLATCMWRYGYSRDRFPEIMSMISAALPLVSERTLIRARGLNAVGFLERQAGRVDRLVGLHTEALSIATEMGDRLEVGQSLFGLGDAAVSAGDSASAERRFQEAAEVFESVENLRGLATAHINLGNVYRDQGRLDLARETFQKSFVGYQEAGDRRGIAWSTLMLGQVAIDLVDGQTARRYLKEAIRGFEELGDPAGWVEVWEGMATLAVLSGLFEVAASLIGAADAVRNRIHLPTQPNDRERVQALREQLRTMMGDADWNAQLLAGSELVRADVDRLVDEVFRNSEHLVVTADIGFTSRELDVLPLICDGLTDREIASRLFVSTRTVNMHVANILAKLGVATRAEVIARVHQNQLLDGIP